MTTMTPERWQRLQRLLDDALELPTAERDAYVAKVSDIDEDMRGELARLVEASGHTGDFLSRPVIDMVPSTLSSLTPPLATRSEGQRIGPYRILREVGRGGMGAVYLAERADDQFRQRVAVKLLPYDVQSDASIRRFLDERQILATMEHPNIARLLDGGMTGDALPYFVMEFVDGAPIDRYCDELRLGIDDRLRLFCTVCEAVQYAHGKLVVHRDIKPSNILVTPQGEARLLDFGIAKLLTADAPQMTSTGLRIMTPEYASPEQVRGEAVTTATDVYSLGVLLYRLLAGRRPYRVTGNSHHEIERAILEDEPEAPSASLRTRDTDRVAAVDIAASRRTTPERLRRGLEGDLDVIVLRALQKEIGRRYASVEQLSADVRRHLEGRPVLARADTLRYRTRKFVRRNRALLGAAGLAAFALIGGTAFSVWQMRRALVQARIASAERDRAQREETKAREIAKFLTEIFRSANPRSASGGQITAREILNRGAQRVQRQLASNPEVRAGVLNEIGDAYTGLGLDRDAIAPLTQALNDQVALHGWVHPEALRAAASLGYALQSSGQTDSAGIVLRAALKAARALPGHPARLSDVLTNLGLVLQVRAQYAESQSMLEEAVALRMAMGDSANATSPMINLGWIFQVRGKTDSAVSLLERARRIRLSAYSAMDGRTEAVTGSLGDMLNYAGRYEAAERMLREARAVAQKIYGERSPDAAGRSLSLASTLLGRGQFRASDSLFRDALAILREQFGDNDVRTALAMNNYGTLLNERGRHAEARAWFTRSVAVYRATLGPTHPSTAIVLGNVASATAYLGDFRGADTLYREAYRLFRLTMPEEHPSVVYLLLSRGIVLHLMGRDREAEPTLRRALMQTRRAHPNGHWRVGMAENSLGSSLSALGRFEEGDTLLVRGYERLLAIQGPQRLETRMARLRVVRHYERWQKPEMAARFRE